MNLNFIRRHKTRLKRLAAAGQIHLDNARRSKAPRDILRTLKVETLSFFARTHPSNDKYPFEVHYAAELENVPENLDRFFLVGRNWRYEPKKPVAVAFGFNGWKYGFIADYCPDVRIAFAARKDTGLGARAVLRQMSPPPSRIYVWGYNDEPWLERFAARRDIPLIRVEDAFLRSADLGARHSTPYSLVFDSQGLYYNAEGPSDLAEILANHDFAGDMKLMQDAGKARDLLIQKRLSKYNLPDFGDPARHFSVKTRKRVLIIGQVDNDAAVRMGNPERWRMSDIVRLAKLENPDAEILYRPHPEVYHGHQRTGFKDFFVASFATIIPPDGSLLDMLDTVDHVYTISSLSGLEALVRDIKVTTLGTPFYAGWGLTDDRIKQQNARVLTIDELFAGVYLKYPCYLADLNDSAFGFQISALRILADSRILECKDMLPKRGQATCPELEMIAQGKAWPNLLIHDRDESTEPVETMLTGRRVMDWMRNNPSDFARSVAAHAVLGWIRSTEQRDRMLTEVAQVLSPDATNELLLNLIDAEGPKPYHFKHLTELLHRSDPSERTARYVVPFSPPLAGAKKNDEADSECENSVEEAEDAALRYRDFLASRFAAQMNDASYDAAAKTAKRLLVRKGLDIETIISLAEIGLVKFDYGAVCALADLLLRTGEPRAISKAPTLELEAMERASHSRIAETVTRYLAFKPDKILNAIQALERLCEQTELLEIKSQVLETVKLANGLSVAKVQSLLSLELEQQALEVADQLARESSHLPQVAVVFAQALAANSKINDARAVIDEALKAHPTSLIYREALRLCILDNDYTRGARLLAEAQSRRIEIGDMLPRKINFGARRIEEAFTTFKHFYLRGEMIRHFPEKYCFDPKATDPGRSIFVAAIFGPGDEMRWAYIYNALDTLLPHSSIRISCDPRLLGLMERSFPNIGFVPVKRIRNADHYEISDFNQVPSSRLIGALDNTAIGEIERADDFVLVSDLLSEVLHDYDSFDGKPFFKADETKVSEYKARLPKNVPLVGLSWRSSVVSHSRNEHYLTVQELAPILEIPSVQFVNLQYDDCRDELNWIESRFPGKVLNFEELDQFNDFDGVAALMRSLDLVISPMTTPAELAGALGCQTWLLSNSSELHWRKRLHSTIDIWHLSLRHIEGAVPANKRLLIQALKDELKAWLGARTSSPTPSERRELAK